MCHMLLLLDIILLFHIKLWEKNRLEGKTYADQYFGCLSVFVCVGETTDDSFLYFFLVKYENFITNGTEGHTEICESIPARGDTINDFPFIFIWSSNRIGQSCYRQFISFSLSFLRVYRFFFLGITYERTSIEKIDRCEPRVTEVKSFQLETIQTIFFFVNIFELVCFSMYFLEMFDYIFIENFVLNLLYYFAHKKFVKPLRVPF